MRQKSFSKNILRTILIFMITTGITLIALSFLIRYDNKYIVKSSFTQENFAQCPQRGYYSLVDGWELYPDQLLTPEELSSVPGSGYHIQAGMYPNLSLFHEDKSPYGAATWRLCLTGSGMATLYLPEPLCASKVYINGQYLGGAGNVSPENYDPLIRDLVVSFPLSEKTELVIQTSNYSHYYGGLWYIPVIGDPDSISHLLAGRMLIYGLLFSSSLSLSLFCIVLWRRHVSREDSTAFYFGMLSLSFALRICYPFFRLPGVSSVRLFYAIEDVAALAGIYFTFQIVFCLFLFGRLNRLRSLLRTLALSVCCMGVLIPLFVLPAFPCLTFLYGQFLSWYKMFMAGLFITLTAYGSFSGSSYMGAVLAATTANGILSFYGVLSFGSYEPLLGAYPEEYGSFCMVIAFAVLMVQRNRDTVLENEKLHLHLQEIVQEKTRHLQQLLAERGQLIAELGHDMKSPLTSLSNMAQIIRLNDIMLDSDTRERMLHIEEQCNILSERLKYIQDAADWSDSPMQAESLELHTFLSDFCRNYRPIIELNGTTFTEKIIPQSCHIMANRERLFRALENLIYNAADFTPPDGEITLSLNMDQMFAYITIADTGCGISEKDLPNIFHRSYTTRTDKGGQGLGLAITRAIVLEHGGQIDVTSKERVGTTFVITLPLQT